MRALVVIFFGLWDLALGGFVSWADAVKIGLFVPTAEKASEGLAVRRGAEMAVREWNSRGGLDGRSLQLVVASADGRWGTASRELVRLIYDEGVPGIIGAVDGRSAHLAEQIVTRAKGKVVFITPRATDPTLTQINIPWFFRIVPDDRQQARVLVREIFERRPFSHVAVVAEEQYDAGMASEFFVRAAGRRSLLRVTYRDELESMNQVARRLAHSRIAAAVLFGRPEATAKLAQLVRRTGIHVSLFEPLHLATSDLWAQPRTVAQDGWRFIPFDPRSPESQRFRRAFEHAYGVSPPLAAAYAYDATCLLLEAIQKSGLSPENLRDFIARTKRAGATGPIRFDNRGNRMAD